MTDQPSKLLFVCVENSCRSQMAEALARQLGGRHVEAASAGSEPSGEVSPKAVAAMAALGYDLGTHRSKSVTELAPGPYAAVITMGCGDRCPAVAAGLIEDWPIPQPRDMAPAPFAEVRDMIAERVRDLLSRLGIPVTNGGTNGGTSSGAR